MGIAQGQVLGIVTMVGLCLPWMGCFGARLSVGPNIDTLGHVGVEASLGVELAYPRDPTVAVSASYAGGMLNGVGSPAGVLAGVAGYKGLRNRGFLDVALLYSAHYTQLPAEPIATEPSTGLPVAMQSSVLQGLRVATTLRLALPGALTTLDPADNFRNILRNRGGGRLGSIYLGPGLYGEVLWRDGVAIGNFGLPLTLFVGLP